MSELKIRKQIVSNLRNTYGRINKKRYITIHETANTSRGANAQAHANLQSRGFTASFHWQVDDKEAIQSYEHDVACWHAGDGRGNGNLNSIAIEICVNSDGDFRKAVENAVKLTRKIMEEENIPIENVVQHNHWSGKNCPTYLRSGEKGVSWSDFKAKLAGKNDTKTKSSTKPKKTTSKPKTTNKSISQMADEVIAGKHGTGHEARRKSLGISKSEYEKVRADVNRRLGVSTPKPKTASKPKKSISQMATEIIQGKHGIGHENRRKSLGIDKATYEKVRQEVNRRLK